MNVVAPRAPMEACEAATGASAEGGAGEAGGSVGAGVAVGTGVAGEAGAQTVGEDGDCAGDEYCEQMVVAFHTIANALAGMQDSMQTMRTTMAKTDSAVQGVKDTLKTHGATVKKLKWRVLGLERRDAEAQRSSSLLKAVRAARAAREEGKAAGTSERADSPADPGLRLPASDSASASTSQSATASKAASAASSSVVCFPRKNRPSLLLQATSRSGTSRTLSLCRPWSRPRVPRSVEVTTPPPVGAACDERLGALGVNLLRAAQAGRLLCVRGLVDAGADPNFAYGCKWSPLHRAAAKAHAGVVSELLERGSDVHATTVYGLTPLHVAAYHDFSGRCVELLMEAKADHVRRDVRGRTPLHYAAENGNLVAVRALRAAGASQNAKDERGRAPFDLAKSAWIRRLIRSCSRCEWSRSYVCRLKNAKRQGKAVTEVTKLTKKKHATRETRTTYIEVVSESAEN